MYTKLTIPGTDASADDKDNFASMFLANWASDRSPSRIQAQLQPDWSPWKEYTAWKGSEEREVKSSLCLLQRFHDHTEVSAERKSQAAARRPIAECGMGDGGHDCLNVSDDESGFDSDLDMDVTHEMLDHEMASLEDGNDAKGSLKGALDIFGDVYPSPSSVTPLGSACVVCDKASIREMSRAAIRRNDELSGLKTHNEPGCYLQLDTSVQPISAFLVAVAATPQEAVIKTINVSDPEQIPALFTPLKSPPSIPDTISLFTLAPGQAQMFVLMATEIDEVLRKEKGLPPPEHVWFGKGPLRLLVLGPPGTGKTRAQLAFQWYAYQHGIHDKVLLTAYPHKAAALLNSPILTASTTCAMMGIDPIRLCLYGISSNSHRKSQALLNDGRWLIMDEVSFYSQTTLALTSRSLQKHAEYKNQKPGDGAHFGEVSVVLTGDLTQHTPPAGRPVFRGAAWESICLAKKWPDIRSAINMKADDVYGRESFLSFDNVLIFNTQHRMMGDPDFASISASFASETPVSTQAIDNFCELVNSSVPTSIHDLLHLSPRIVVTRNDVKNHISRALDIAQVIS